MEPTRSDISTTVSGVKHTLFGVEYRHDGGLWSFHLYATDIDDAKRRLRSIRGNAEIYGEIVAEIKAYPGVGLWVRARVFCLNLFSRKRD